MKRRRNSKAVVAVIADELAPTAELQHRHQIVRHGAARRIRTRLERWLDDGQIEAASADAGRRFAVDHADAVGKRPSSWTFGLARETTTGHDVTQYRLDAAARLRAAIEALDGPPGGRVGVRPSQLVGTFVVLDRSVREIAGHLGVRDERKLKRRIVELLDRLAVYYDDVDRQGGRGDLAHTQAQASERFVPELPDAA